MLASWKGIPDGWRGRGYRFRKEVVAEAVKTGAPVDFAAGTFVATSLSANPLLFDRACLLAGLLAT